MPRNYWMVVTTGENFQITAQQGFTVLGMKDPYRKRAQRMERGDRVLYYIKGAMQFAATASITSGYFADRSPLWKPETPGELYSHRVHIKPEVALKEGEHLDARQIAPRMEYVRKWHPEDWPLAFEGQLHLVPKNDFALIEDEMRKVARGRDASQDAKTASLQQPPQS